MMVKVGESACCCQNKDVGDMGGWGDITPAKNKSPGKCYYNAWKMPGLL